MDIKLCYVHGISRVDTPYFPTLRNQEDYFDSHEVVTVETTFYPPHYNNVIRFDISDVSLLDNINYLYFIFANKRYYYFIDSIEYVSESLFDLHIVMDVIQTFMFNINFSNGIIERKFINRWSSSTEINREYLRENVSDGLFTNQYTNIFNNDLWLVIKVSQIGDGWDISTRVTINEKDSYVPYAYCYLPLFCNKIRYTQLSGRVDPHDGATVETRDIDFTKIVTSLRDSHVLDAYIIDYNPRPYDFSIIEENDDKILLISNYEKPWNTDTMLAGYHEYLQFINNVIACCIEHVYRYDALRLVSNVSSYKHSISLYRVDQNLTFYRNTQRSMPFDPQYITQLLDENYLRIEYGNAGGMATYPLFTITYLDNILLSEYYNFDDGSKVFAIEPSNKTLVSGLDYMTYVNSNLVPSVALLNDAWNQYVSNNRSRWASAGFGAVRNAVSSFILLPSKNEYLNTKIASLKADPNKYDKRYKNPTLKESFNRKMSSYESRKENVAASGIVGGLMGISPLVSQGINDMNAYYSPDSIRQAGDFITGYLSTQLHTVYRELRVNDYVQCANYFHRNGYKVNERVNEISNPFAYVQNRFYFNILKIAEADIHLTDYIENYDLLESIGDRLKDGVRLWNVLNSNNSIGNFEYDNVELDYLS